MTTIEPNTSPVYTVDPPTTSTTDLSAQKQNYSQWLTVANGPAGYSPNEVVRASPVENGHTILVHESESIDVKGCIDWANGALAQNRYDAIVCVANGNAVPAWPDHQVGFSGFDLFITGIFCGLILSALADLFVDWKYRRESSE